MIREIKRIMSVTFKKDYGREFAGLNINTTKLSIQQLRKIPNS